MDEEAFTSAHKDDPVQQMARQSLDPLSLDELDARISALKAEIIRCEDHKKKAAAHRLAADALFGKKP